ncbi:MAG: saccharopine dehydrogenase NADP-binding domain-containing protein [Betaproteobacteria bacterium]|nr:saccharopine dehydrogenase NADP-binding domain-containing protein [Betaproteobacteria bacterium]
MRVVVLGGSGNFGARICRQLGRDSRIQVIAAGRHSIEGTTTPLARNGIDLYTPDFAAALRELHPDLVIHCAGPYQGQDYRVAQAALDCGAHYIDLADGREFVTQFSTHNHATASRAERVAVAGASTLPALSSAVVDSLLERFVDVEEIAVAIAPGQHAPRGTATMAAVLSYAGRGFRWWEGGAWRTAYGWQELRRVRFPFGTRCAAACDVPDLTLFPDRYRGVRTVTFRAALEVPLQHYALWCIAGLRRIGVPLAAERWAGALNRAACWLDRLGSDRGGMSVRLVGTHKSGRRWSSTWYLVAKENHGPEIPCMASVLLTRKLVAGERLPHGARACMGMLRLSEFEPEFARWDIRTSIEESAA